MNDIRSRPPCNIYIVTQGGGTNGNVRPLVGAPAPALEAPRLGYDPLPPTPDCTRLDGGYRRCCITSPYDGTTHCAILPPNGDNGGGGGGNDNAIVRRVGAALRPPADPVSATYSYALQSNNLSARPIVETFAARQEQVRGAYDCRVMGTGRNGQLWLECLPD